MADLVRAIETSNLSAHHKASFVDKVMGMARSGKSSVLARAGSHGIATVHTIGELGTGAVVGAAAGMLHATVGLDHKQGAHVIPLDAAGAAGFGLLSIGIAHMEPAASRASSAVAGKLATVFAFRKGYDFTAEKRKAAGKSVAGTFGSDEEWANPGIGADGSNAAEAALLRLSNRL